MDNRILVQAAHEMNRIYCIAIGDETQQHWEYAPNWQKNSAIKGVEGVLNGDTPEETHQSWLNEKTTTGWSYGPVKDSDKKEHPCMVPYEELPVEQQLKDEVFMTTVLLMSDVLDMLTEQKACDISK